MRARRLRYADYGQIDGRGLFLLLRLPILLLPSDRGGRGVRGPLCGRGGSSLPLSSAKTSQDNKDVCYLWASEKGRKPHLAGWLAGCTRISISIPLQPASLLSLSPPCSFSTSHSALDIELLCTTSDQLLGNVLELDWLLGAQKRNSKIQIRLHLTSHDMLLFGRRRFKGSKVQRLQSR